MYRNKRILAIIPARGGSKRLPGKNIKSLCGKPLIAWTIEAALTANVFDEIMVNTDDLEIANTAKKYGALIPFIRKSELASDTASSIDVVTNTLKYYNENKKLFDIVVLLQPTSPLRSPKDIQNSLDLFMEKDASSVLTVCEVDHPVQWANSLDNTFSLDNFIREDVKGKRSQDLDIHYRLNGAIYVWSVKKLLKVKEAILFPSFAHIMPRERSVDIDEEVDFKIAEVLVKNSTQTNPYR